MHEGVRLYVRVFCERVHVRLCVHTSHARARTHTHTHTLTHYASMRAHTHTQDNEEPRAAEAEVMDCNSPPEVSGTRFQPQPLGGLRRMQSLLLNSEFLLNSEWFSRYLRGS